jgi:hypothetical protein
MDRRQPVKNRNAISMGMFMLRALAIKQQSARRFPIWETGSLPNLSESGAMKNGPIPSPSSQGSIQLLREQAGRGKCETKRQFKGRHGSSRE